LNDKGLVVYVATTGHDALILGYGHLGGRNHDAPTAVSRLNGLRFLACAGAGVPLVPTMDVHDTRGGRGGHLLRLEHLLLEVLAVTQLVLLDREAQSVVVVVAHGQLVAIVVGRPAHIMARLEHDGLAAILIVGSGTVRARM